MHSDVLLLVHTLYMVSLLQFQSCHSSHLSPAGRVLPYPSLCLLSCALMYCHPSPLSCGSPSPVKRYTLRCLQRATEYPSSALHLTPLHTPHPSPPTYPPFFIRPQPISQPCGRPSSLLWHTIRSLHLLPPQGLPVLPSDPTIPSPPPVFPNNPTPVDPSEWVIVVAGPKPVGRTGQEFRSLSVATELARKLLGLLFGRERVVVFRPLPPMDGEEMNRHL